MNKLANFLIGGALAGGCLGPAFPGMAEDQAGTPDLGALQQSLAAEQKRIEELAQLAERAAADQQQLGNLQRENQQLRGELAKLHEQVQVAEGRANDAEAERDQLRGELGKLREQAAAAAEDASRSLVTVVSRIKDLDAVAATQPAAGQIEPAAPPQQPAPPVVAPPSQPAKRPTHVAKNAAPAAAPAPKAQPEQEVKTAAIEAEHTDQRAVLAADLRLSRLPTCPRKNGSRSGRCSPISTPAWTSAGWSRRCPRMHYLHQAAISCSQTPATRSARSGSCSSSTATERF
jgi:hypothetical protein